VIFPINTENEWRIKFLSKFVRTIRRVSFFLYIKRLMIRICFGYGDRSSPGFIFWSIRFRYIFMIKYWSGTLSSSMNWFIRCDISFKFIDGMLDNLEFYIVVDITSSLYLEGCLLRRFIHILRSSIFFRYFPLILRIRLI